MTINWLALLVAALVPLLIGFFWYGKALFNDAWMKEAGMTEEQIQGGNMGKIFGISFVMSLFIALALNFIVIHQMHLYSIFMNEPGINDPNSDIGKYLADFMAKNGSNFRTFKHGAIHGGMDGFFLATSVLGINALFERKSLKYIAINSGYWILTMAIMGGIICAWQ
jgi:hypothetical protein